VIEPSADDPRKREGVTTETGPSIHRNGTGGDPDWIDADLPLPDPDLGFLENRVYAEPAPELETQAPAISLQDFAAVDLTNDKGEPLPPPHDIEAEIGVLGSLLLLDERLHAADGEIALRVLEALEPTDFYTAPHAALYRVLAEMRRAGPVDSVLLREELQRRGVLARIGGTSTISRILQSVPSAANAEHYAKIVKRTARKRELLAAAALLKRSVFMDDDAAVDLAVQHAHHAHTRPLVASPTGVSGDAIQDAFGRGEIAARSWFLEGIFHTGHVGEVVGPQSGGKSALLWELAILAATPGNANVVRWPIAPRPADSPWRVGLILGENETGEVAERLYSIFREARWPKDLIVFELLALDEPPDLAQPEGRAWFERIVREHNLEVLVIDNLTSLCGGDFNDNTLAKATMGWLRRFARRNAVTPIMGVHTGKTNAQSSRSLC
jgi:hypothetical protein